MQAASQLMLMVFLFQKPLREAVFAARDRDPGDQAATVEPFQEQANRLRVEPVGDLGQVGVDVVLGDVGECDSDLIQPVQDFMALWIRCLPPGRAAGVSRHCDHVTQCESHSAWPPIKLQRTATLCLLAQSSQ
ncbi:hypothetical protein [Nocardia sp. NPDC003979]